MEKKKHTILLRNFKVEKQGTQHLYSVHVFGDDTYSFLSDSKMNDEIENAKASDNDRLFREKLEFACKKILIHNDFFFDEIEMI